MSTNDQLVDKLKNVSEKDRKQIQDAQEMLGPDPSTMGFIKNNGSPDVALKVLFRVFQRLVPQKLKVISRELVACFSDLNLYNGKSVTHCSKIIYCKDELMSHCSNITLYKSKLVASCILNCNREKLNSSTSSQPRVLMQS